MSVLLTLYRTYNYVVAGIIKFRDENMWCLVCFVCQKMLLQIFEAMYWWQCSCLIQLVRYYCNAYFPCIFRSCDTSCGHSGHPLCTELSISRGLTTVAANRFCCTNSTKHDDWGCKDCWRSISQGNFVRLSEHLYREASIGLSPKYLCPPPPQPF